MIELRVLSSLEKVFPKQEPNTVMLGNSFFKNENHSFQVAYSLQSSLDILEEFSFQVEGAPNGVEVKIYDVKLMPSEYASHPKTDDNYLTTDPGLFPDLLEEKNDNIIKVHPSYWKSLWVELIASPQTKGGKYSISIKFYKEGKEINSVVYDFVLIDANLPEQELYCTQWFHSDCLCNYYNVDVFSDEYWQLVENYLKTSVEHGMNMVLTPVLTPPLDTEIGGERLTVQLIKIMYDDNKYSFNFDNFKKWVMIAKKAGIKYFEISHLFSQWGAAYAPKVIVHTEGVAKHMFGWHTAALSEEYTTFLKEFLSNLVKEIKSLGIEKQCFFHISDEPSLEALDSYKKAKDLIKPYILDFPLIDALSDFDFYKHGAVECPIPANNHIEPFLEAKVDPLWVYYCTAQYIDVSNRFFSMPSARNRIIGYQMFKFDICGFLHWGYNFWNTMHSKKAIDPYKVTDAGCAFPSGDSFLVYPGQDYQAAASIRLKVFSEALYDLRAMKMLEKLSSKDEVLKIIDSQNNMTFSKYPHGSEYILETREIINQKIMQLL